MSRIKTAIEILETEIKVVQISTDKSTVRVTAYAAEEIPSNDIKSASDNLRQILKKFKIKPKEIVLSIPRQSVTTKILNLPSHDPAEIEEMAGFQTIKQIPYPKEEIAFGVAPIEMTVEGYSKVMLVICHRDVLERPVEVLKNCGLTPSKITLSSFGMLNWLRLNPVLIEASKAAPLILVEADRKSTDIVIADADKLIYTRGLTFGLNEGGRYLEKLKEEVSKTLSALEKEFFALKPALAVFTGNVSGFADRKDFIGKTIDIKTEFIDSFKPLSASTPERFGSFSAESSFSSLIGCGVGPYGVDLLPRKIRSAHSARSKRNEFLFSVSLAIAVVILASLAVLNRIQQKEAFLRILDKQLESVTPAAQEVEKMKAVTDIVRSELSDRSRPLAILNELYRIIPPSISLTFYQYEEGKVNIKGTTSVLSEVFRFVKLLDESSYFQNVEVKYAVKRRTQDIESVDFEVDCPLSGRTKAKR